MQMQRKSSETTWIETVFRLSLIACLAMPLEAKQAMREDGEKPPAGGIQTDFGDVLIENLGIGRTYNLRDLAGTPLKVTNTGAGTVDLTIDVQIPTEGMIFGNRREMGFRPIPSVDWVKISQSQFIVPAGESAYTDVVISIPNDPSLYGKKFQASIYSRTTGKQFLNLGVWSHLLITIIPSSESQTQMEKDRKRGLVGNMDYTLLPDKLVLVNPPLGRAYDVTKENKKTIKLANSGSAPVKLRVQLVPVGNTPLSLQTGFVEGNPTWLKVKSEIVDIEPDSFADPGLFLHLPDDPKIKQKKYMFVLKVEPADPDVVGVTFYGKVYVDFE